VSPRKSSTSSGNLSHRPRYLAVEVAGDLPIPPRQLERELQRRASRPGRPPLDLRIIRIEGRRALVRVAHLDVASARAVWNGPATDPIAPPFSLRTDRSYGTLRKGKAWLRRRERSPTSAPRTHDDQ
jgi:hypothetical protein